MGVPSGAAVRRYAQAVFEMADEQGTLEAWERDLSALAGAFDDPKVAAYFESPQVPAAQKRSTAEQLLGPAAQPLARNLIGLLIERNRIRYFPQIYQSFHDRMLERQGIAVGEVTTAVPLGPEELALVRQRLGAVVGKQIELRTSVDPQIIGGIVARVGDQLIDGSVVGQLRKLRERLAAAER
jgi:F-type H+-transporting ATPase subunit delta